MRNASTSVHDGLDTFVSSKGGNYDIIPENNRLAVPDFLHARN